MKKIVYFLLIATLTGCASKTETQHLFSYQEHTLFSETMQESRTLLIYTPDSYQAGTAYPVLYVLDGEYLFEYVVPICKYLYDCELIPEMIVVGISNVDRERDFLPTHLSAVQTSGGAAKFGECLHYEILPFIENNVKSSGYNILFGHSYGGLFTEYIFAQNKDAFHAYIAASPSVYWDGLLVPGLIGQREYTSDHLVYNFFSMGSYERNEMINGTITLDSVLSARDFMQVEHKYEFMKGEDHATTRMKTLEEGLKYTFRKWYYPYKNDRSNFCLDSLYSYYERLSERSGVTIIPPESPFYYIGYYKLQQGENEEALKTFSDANKLYPASPKSYTNLATAFERTGDKHNALKYYQEALQVTSGADPLHHTIEQKIEKIRNEVMKMD